MLGPLLTKLTNYMIKKTKKLSLNKETVQSMDSQIKRDKPKSFTNSHGGCCCGSYAYSLCDKCYPGEPVVED